MILGGLFLPQTGVVDAIRGAALMREAAISAGALAAFPHTEVTGIDVEAGRITGVRTARGQVRTDTVVICCGVWSSRIARMAGATIPFQPGVSQLVSVGPIAAFADLPGEISFPVIRDSDPKIYARRVGGDMELGSAGHRPILVDPDDIPSLEEATLTPTELPFTPDDFDPALEAALELFPSLFEDPRAGIRYSINGLVSLCADGLPIVGRQPEVEGLWSANRIDIKMAPAVARILATWLVKDIPESALSPYDLARFLPHERTPTHVRAPAAEWWSRNYEMVHPAREFMANRNLRLGPFHDRLQELGGAFQEQAGWEIAKWCAADEPLSSRFGDRVLTRTHEWDARWWSPIAHAEHLAMREGAGLEDRTAQAVFEVTGPGAAAWLDSLRLPDRRRSGSGRPELAARPGWRRRHRADGARAGSGPLPCPLASHRGGARPRLADPAPSRQRGRAAGAGFGPVLRRDLGAAGDRGAPSRRPGAPGAGGARGSGWCASRGRRRRPGVVAQLARTDGLDGSSTRRPRWAAGSGMCSEPPENPSARCRSGAWSAARPPGSRLACGPGPSTSSAGMTPSRRGWSVRAHPSRPVTSSVALQSWRRWPATRSPSCARWSSRSTPRRLGTPLHGRR